MAKIPVAVVGATGLAGQQFLASLARHPQFELRRLGGSPRSAGKTLRAALTDGSGALRWYPDEPLPADAAALTIQLAEKLELSGIGCVFTAIESDPARELEPLYARNVPVVSTASAFRMEPDVPLLIPPVNAAHADLIEVQRRKRGWKGFIAPIPNCTVTGLAIALKPLADAFGLRRVLMTSLQSASGAGRNPGVLALDAIDNVIPFIPGEEEKVQQETGKLLGTLGGDQIQPHAAQVSCTCTRVPVLEGHTESVFVELERPATVAQARDALRSFGEGGPASALPSAPPHWIDVFDDPYRPQPRRDRDAGGGMTTSVGRLRADPTLGHGLKFVLVSHNTKMGAARGALLVAELLASRGLIK
jgi:aspartate-semialdehyde dehydrogenase